VSEPSRSCAPATTVRAVVHAAGAATPYTRSGHGATVVLLVGPERADLLSRRLAARHRVLVPEVPALRPVEADAAGRLAFCLWLRSFLDGLGVDRAAVVAGGGQARAALAFALLEEDRVERLVLWPGDGAAGEGEDAFAPRPPCPLLALPPAVLPTAAVEATARFLAATD
jgi:pimeloyl-ACP methyl ester carboxylesterase